MLSKRILPIIVTAQFCSGSLWFASNGIMTELIGTFDLDQNALGNLTSAVQFGFIIGTLLYALLTISDRFSPSKVFLVSALAGALFNLGLIYEENTILSLVSLRFLTGFFLAGIYPVGMKIASDYYEKGLGKSLGYLVGALVLGTAFPHLLSDLVQLQDWRLVVFSTSIIASFGGLIIYFLVPDGPFRKKSQKIDLSAFINVFKNSKFRGAAFGYFGHMWELYAFWAFVPFVLISYNAISPDLTLNIPIHSFVIIGIGGISCVIGGYLSLQYGAKKMASIALSISGFCCLISPFIFKSNSYILMLSFLIIWGMAVVADSPLFSTLVANNASPEIKGTALTIVNSIGFAITILSIQLLSYLSTVIHFEYIFIILFIGPLLGLIGLWRNDD